MFARLTFHRLQFDLELEERGQIEENGEDEHGTHVEEEGAPLVPVAVAPGGADVDVDGPGHGHVALEGDDGRGVDGGHHGHVLQRVEEVGEEVRVVGSGQGRVVLPGMERSGKCIFRNRFPANPLTMCNYYRRVPFASSQPLSLVCLTSYTRCIFWKARMFVLVQIVHLIRSEVWL